MTSAQAALFRTVPEKDYLVFWTAAQVPEQPPMGPLTK